MNNSCFLKIKKKLYNQIIDLFIINKLLKDINDFSYIIKKIFIII